ncbi:hypothetical protein ABZ351_28675 [Streptomyces microflavus]|uniref:hypothetical protein n=1 Tax=Streptomyces microflavus TaxID=1919 RepID=UPI00340AE8A5
MDEIAYDGVDLLYRRLHAKFRATTYHAAEQRLRASWGRFHASQDTSSPDPKPPDQG